MAFAPGYSTVVIGFMAALVATLVVGVSRVKRSAAVPLTTILLGWFALVYVLGARGAFASNDLPLPIFVAVTLPILLGGLAISRIGPVKDALFALSQQWLVGLHLVRLIGFLFLWEWLEGTLPGSFALPAGIGDVTVAITAPFVAMRLARKPNRTGWLWAWNVFGILDFVVAVTTGALSAGTALRVFYGGPPANALGELPLSLVPTFGVPLVALTHFVSISKLRHGARSTIAPAFLPKAI